MIEPTSQPQKKPHEEALAIFEAADSHYKKLEEDFLSGEFLIAIVDRARQRLVQNGGSDLRAMGEAIRLEYQGYIEDLKDALEERNVRLKNLQDILRQQVTLEVTKQRGPEGKATSLDVGPFTASSRTSRWFDSKSLFDGVAKHGLLERLHELKTLDKEGKEKKLVQQVWEIDYANVLAWLKANKLDDVIVSAYDESEISPQVKGPKPKTFLGDDKP